VVSSIEKIADRIGLNLWNQQLTAGGYLGGLAKILILENLPVKYCGHGSYVHRHPVSPLESVRRFLSRLKTAGLGRKIFWEKDLARRYSVFKELFLTAFAGAIMNEFEMRRKVRCHKGGLWKIPGSPRRGLAF
jgi:hypothetical protein